MHAVGKSYIEKEEKEVFIMTTATTADLPVEFLATTYLGEKGQLTIPKQYRDLLTLETGAPIAVLQLGEGLLLIPEQARFRQLCERISTAFARHNITPVEVMAGLPEAREQVFAELYPELAESQSARKKRR